MVCIQPWAMPPSKEMMFELQYSRYKDVRDSSRQFVNNYQKSEFRVVCTDLSDGLPDPNDGFQFVVPRAVLGDDGDEDTIQVTASAYVIK
jgi:E3 ubiquitin-protein ligase SIAH1